MLPAKRERLSGWGLYPAAQCQSWRPEKRRELPMLLQEHAGPLIARGMGRSYGDASLQPAGVLRTGRLDHIIAFDAVQGIVRAQAGVTLADVMALAIPRGWLPPVIPGTRFVSLGGAFACNVHGKNHWRDGDFAEHVPAIRLMLAGGESIACSPSENAELFWATAGGMGMTGIIEEVMLKLRPIASASLRATSCRVDSIEGMVAAFEHSRGSADYMVGWIDHMATGGSLGSGVFEAANHLLAGDGGAALAGYAPPKAKIALPLFAPSFLLNRYVMAAYNKWRFKKYSTARQTETVDFNGFFHPLDGIGQWNRLYGKRGFFQYQCLIPETPDVAAQLRAFLTLLQERQVFSFLAVIKYHRAGIGYLTFPLAGYSIALDFPNTPRVRAMLPELDQWIAAHGGRSYLAKDALLTPELFDNMYGQKAQEWRAIIRGIDPEGRFASLMSQRLGWKEGRA